MVCIYFLFFTYFVILYELYHYILDPPCHHSCPESLSEMCSTTVHSEKVDIAGKTIECEDLGFSITFPPGAVISPVIVSVCCSFKREFSPPDGYQFVSPVYILHVHPETLFLKKVTLSLQHWAKSDGSDLRFATCPFPNQSYPFEVKDSGDFTSHSHYGRIEVDHFSLGAIIKKLLRSLRIGRGQLLLYTTFILTMSLCLS